MRSVFKTGAVLILLALGTCQVSAEDFSLRFAADTLGLAPPRFLALSGFDAGDLLRLKPFDAQAWHAYQLKLNLVPEISDSDIPVLGYSPEFHSRSSALTARLGVGDDRASFFLTGRAGLVDWASPFGTRDATRFGYAVGAGINYDVLPGITAFLGYNHSVLNPDGCGGVCSASGLNPGKISNDTFMLGFVVASNDAKPTQTIPPTFASWLIRVFGINIGPITQPPR